MNTHQTSLPVQLSATSSRFIQIGCAAFLGLFVIGAAGFSHIERSITPRMMCATRSASPATEDLPDGNIP